MKHLLAKIGVPQAPGKLLPRTRIAALIDGAPSGQIIWLTAPYGCGKTLAVISWLKESGRKAAWLTLDSDDNSGDSFFSALAAAILHAAGSQDPSGGVRTASGYDADPQDLLRDAILYADKQPVPCDTLVIDDFGFIDEPALLRAVKDFVFSMLNRWRIVIISRRVMPSVFNDLMLRGYICPVTLKKLSFSKEETAAFFEMNGCTVSKRGVLRIQSSTEGWPAALNAVLASSRDGPPAYGETARAYVSGFFDSEIWEELSGDVKDFLMKTSMLDKLTPAACNAVTDIGATLPILKRLYDSGLFISRLDEDETYRYQNVFKEFLREKLDASGIAGNELYGKIAWFLFECREYVHSFPYFFKAHDMYGLSRVLRMFSANETGLEQYLDIIGCMTSLNAEELKNYPIIVAKMALIHFALGNLSEMKRLYDMFQDWIEPGVLPLSPEEYAECVWECGWLCYLNPSEQVLNNKKHEQWNNYVEYVPYLKTLHYSRAAAYRFPSALSGIRDYCTAVASIESFAKYNRETGYSVIYEESSLWQIELIRAEYAYELEKFAFAESIIRGVMPEFEKRKLTDLYLVGTAIVVKLVRAAHDPREVGALMARLEAMIRKNGHFFLMPHFHALELRIRLADGIAGQTDAFERENRTYLDKPYFYMLYRHITLSRALLSTGQFSEAILLLDGLERLCFQYDRIMDLIEIDVLRAIADYGVGNTRGARRYITEAINRAREYGFIRVFSDNAQGLWPVLELLGKSSGDAYVKSIIISCKKTLTHEGLKPPRSGVSNSDLTKTELRILKTLGAGLSYEEMALDNNIKVSTLKSHLHSIYSKLDVVNRTSAVIKARDMGIVE